MTTSLTTTQLGRTGMHLTRVGFGAWAIGGGDWAFAWGNQDDAESVSAIRHAVESGLHEFTGNPRFTPPWLGSSQRDVTTLPRV
jgi:diketogulonate reductase-like aldo/keto reductase